MKYTWYEGIAIGKHQTNRCVCDTPFCADEDARWVGGRVAFYSSLRQGRIRHVMTCICQPLTLMKLAAAKDVMKQEDETGKLDVRARTYDIEGSSIYHPCVPRWGLQLSPHVGVVM